MGETARIMILLGAVLIVVGLVLLVIPRLPFAGKLPGDVLIKREHYTLSIPIATSIVISIVISLILYCVNKFK
jgi:hypothetical protein